MKALVVEQFGTLQLSHWPAPIAGPGEVVVDVHAASINFPDLLVIDGKYQLLPALPFVPGKECAGVVVQVAADVTALKPNDRVLVQVEHGAFAQRLAAKAASCHLIPDRMTYVDAAAMGLAYSTAYFALFDRGGLKGGETVLITGAAGGVGLAAVQIAHALGATVLAAVSAPDKAAAARAAGADYIIAASVPNLRDAVRAQVHAALGERGVELIIENVGGDLFDACLRTIAWCGRLVVVGFAGGRIPEIKAGYILVKNISVIGLQVSDYRDKKPERWAQVIEELFKLHSAGKLQPHVMATFPLGRHREALELLKDRKVIGKVVFTMK